MHTHLACICVVNTVANKFSLVNVWYIAHKKHTEMEYESRWNR